MNRRHTIVSLQDITITLVARNAAQTIARAVKSAVRDSDGPILLVDDASNDETAAIAKDVAGEQITIITPDTHAGVGNARQTAIDAITTPYGIWLDADDTFIPGRTARHLNMLKKGQHDLVYDEGTLINGADDSFMHDLFIPDFICKDGMIARQFERNWLPLTHCSFVTPFARSVGFDTTFQAAEDYDFMLRAIMKGARCGFVRQQGYRYYHYPSSLSRALDTATLYSTRAVAKHSDKHLTGFLDEGRRLGEIESLYIRAVAARSRGELMLARTLLTALLDERAEITPYGASAHALAHFILGVLCLEGDRAQQNAAQAEAHFMAAQQAWPAKEVRNNLGVVYAMQGDTAKAQRIWQRLLEDNPHYLDAHLNKSAQSVDALHLTKSPFRPQSGRTQYTAK